MSKTKMMNHVIALYGLESEEAIDFCAECESASPAERAYLIERYFELMSE